MFFEYTTVAGYDEGSWYNGSLLTHRDTGGVSIYVYAPCRMKIMKESTR